MGQITLDLWAGGGLYLAPGANTTLRWWRDRRVQTIKATAGSLVMTIVSASNYVMPWGPQVLIVVNPKDATFAFTLVDAALTWSESVAVGQLVFVSRVRDGAGNPTWWPMKRTIK